jgi:hypothetical protein
MAQQAKVREVLIVGDSNVRRHLFRTGRSYAQAADCAQARNLDEFAEACQKISPDNYKLVVFAMLTNIVVTAGSSGHDHDSRMLAIDECLDTLISDIRLVFHS